MASRSEVIQYCNERLDAASYQDVAVNGLQVEGRPAIERLAIAVSTSQYILQQVSAWNADALLVHHGLLWGSRQGPISGLLAARLRLIFQHDLNLIGYHLPLDGHPEIGNNALLVKKLSLEPVRDFAPIAGQSIGMIGRTMQPTELGDFTGQVASLLDRAPIVIGNDDAGRPVEMVGVVSGSGYSALHEAKETGCDALLTGDVREPTMAEARELGMTVLVAGHEATERFGVQALGSEIASQFDIECRYFHDPNPI